MVFFGLGCVAPLAGGRGTAIEEGTCEGLNKSVFHPGVARSVSAISAVGQYEVFPVGGPTDTPVGIDEVFSLWAWRRASLSWGPDAFGITDSLLHSMVLVLFELCDAAGTDVPTRVVGAAVAVSELSDV